ncbi:unnamed protein product [Rotaria socialis]|uniref:Mutator-like transposase domain-containing protein n=1 Tax=Rotaria socialis TaxID=392032 RepID=A0A818CIB0_9BILA|nr:unnamed protein product [Rotaria socialis]
MSMHYWHNQDVTIPIEATESYNNVNLIVGLQILTDLVNHFSCPSCHRIGKISSKVTQRRGLLYHIAFSCECSFETSMCNSSPLHNPASSRMDELNMLACIAANVGGIKRRAEEAADQAQAPFDEEGVTNVTVTIDGSWLTRRGHSSLHGLATCCSTADPPKVLDYQVLSRHCSTCSGLLGVKEFDKDTYQRLLIEHLESGYDANHTGSSAGMEAAGKNLCCTLDYFRELQRK